MRLRLRKSDHNRSYPRRYEKTLPVVLALIAAAVLVLVVAAVLAATGNFPTVR